MMTVHLTNLSTTRYTLYAKSIRLILKQTAIWTVILSLIFPYAPQAEALTIPHLPSADPLALARAQHYYNQLEYDKALSELSRIASETNYHPTVVDLMSEITSRLMQDEAQAKKQAEENYQGKVSLAVSNVGIDFAEDPYKDFPETRFTQKVTSSYKSLSGLPRDATDKTISEYVRMETQVGEYHLDTTLQYEYFNGPDDNTRLRHLNQRIKGPFGTLNLGDSSVYFSRYVLNGVDYTGVDLLLDLPRTELELLYGRTPFFQPAAGDDKYIYPRDIFGVRNEFSPHVRWKAGQSFAYLRDSPNRVRTLSILNAPRDNVVLGFDNDVDIMPGLLDLYHETVYTHTDPDTLTDVVKRNDFAHYVETKLSMRKLKILSTVEYIGPDFESGGGYASFQTVDGTPSFLRQNGISNDRLHYEASLTYTPKDWVYTNLQWSRTRNKLGDTQDIFPTTQDRFIRSKTPEHTREDWWQGNLRLDLPGELPRLGARFTQVDVLSVPGSVNRSNNNTTRQLHLNLSKQIQKTHLDTRYELETFEDETGEFDDELRHLIGFTASRYLANRVGLFGGYTYLRKDKQTTANASQRLAEDHEINLNASAPLKWGASSSLSYTFNQNDDFTATVTDKQTHRLGLTFSWPWTGKLFGKQEVTVDPYLSYYKDLSTDASTDRDAFSAKVEAHWKIVPGTLLTLSADYRNDNLNGTIADGTGEEARVFMSLHSEIGLTTPTISQDNSFSGHKDES